jgi:Fe(3+) dicitrate transport protein
VNYQVNPALLVNVDVTRMSYLAQQAGGLTDVLFQRDPRASLRKRNWFKVDWNLVALNFTYKFSHLTELNVRNFGLVAERNALGILDKINMADFGGNRDLIAGQFRNMGNETRLLHRYEAFGKQHALLTGFRLYHGTTTAKQGWANNSSGPDFYFLNPEDVEKVNYTYPNKNYAFFMENIFDITPKFSVTPGIRFENIRTYSKGYYKTPVYDMAGNLVAEERTDEDLSNERSLMLAGIGVSYKAHSGLEFYGNISRNYRGINFSDLRIINPVSAPSQDIKDEKGFTADAGARGRVGNLLNYELTAFYVSYDGKIGNKFGFNEKGMEYRIRDNISDSRNIGFESFAELDLTRLFDHTGDAALSLFVNTAIIDARYIRSEDASVRNKKVEMVPPIMIRSGSAYRYKGFTASAQFSYVAMHYTDATNAERTASAIEGAVPAYYIVDFSTGYEWRNFRIEANCNNVLDHQYFTRRAENYPGPGIIPSEGRGFLVTLQAKVGK